MNGQAWESNYEYVEQCKWRSMVKNRVANNSNGSVTQRSAQSGNGNA